MDTATDCETNERPRTPRGERGGWASHEGFRLVERDVAILFTVGRLKVAKRRHVERLHFGSPHTCRDRLAKLREAGLIRTFFRDLHEDNLVALTERGRRVLCEQAGLARADVSVTRELPRQIEHLSGINDVRVEVSMATRRPGTIGLAFFLPSWELQRIANPARFGIVPDALVGLDSPHRQSVLALEIDLGTEAPTFVARRKLAVYQRLVGGGVGVYGYMPESVVLLAPGLRRLRLLANAAAAANVTEGVVLGDLNDRATKSLLAPKFARAIVIAGRRAEEIVGLLGEPISPELVACHTDAARALP